MIPASLRKVALLPSVLTIAACCTGDPAKDGFACGVGGLAGGTYSERVTEREAALDETVEARNRLARRSAELHDEREALDRQEATLFVELDRLQRQNGDLRARLNEAMTRRDTDRARLGDLEAQLADLQRQQQALSSNPQAPGAAAAAADIARQQAAISSAIDQILAVPVTVE